jgi:hypothetical protein
MGSSLWFTARCGGNKTGHPAKHRQPRRLTRRTKRSNRHVFLLFEPTRMSRIFAHLRRADTPVAFAVRRVLTISRIPSILLRRFIAPRDHNPLRGTRFFSNDCCAVWSKNCVCPERVRSANTSANTSANISANISDYSPSSLRPVPLALAKRNRCRSSAWNPLRRRP